MTMLTMLAILTSLFILLILPILPSLTTLEYLPYLPCSPCLPYLPSLFDRYIERCVAALIAAKGGAWWQACLETEFGGMNEVGASLSAITGDPAHERVPAIK